MEKQVKSFEQINQEYNVALATLGFKSMQLERIPKEMDAIKAQIMVLSKQIEDLKPNEVPKAPEVVQ